MTGRVLLVALGAVAALIGLALAAVAVVLLLVTGRDGAFGGRAGTLSTQGYALVSDAAGLGTGGGDGSVRVRVRSTDDGPVFVGVAPAATVTRYLSGAPYDELTDVRLSPLRATLVPHDGSGTPPAPTSQAGWTVRASGSGEQTVQVPVQAGGQRLVVMNADGSPGLEVDASLALTAPFLRHLAVGLLVAGVVVAPVGGAVLALGVRRSVRARAG